VFPVLAVRVPNRAVMRMNLANVTVIIPALNEEQDAAERARRLATCRAGDCRGQRIERRYRPHRE